MTSSMLAGERRWASARRGGMTVLGKVAVPKPLNLPSQKLENHGLDPNVEIVPKGSLSWGSRPSSSTSNPWGSSAVSPNADASNNASPHHPSGRPSSGGGLSRPSTGGSERMHEPSANSWGPNSRPSSASGVLTSNQSPLTSSRPLSAETRPGSSHLSRFAEPAFDNSMAWGPNGTADKLSIPSKANDFSLSSGDFPTLGSEKDNTPKSSEAHDHGSHVRPGSASGRTAATNNRNDMSQADHKSGTVETWTRDGPPPHEEKWHGEPQPYMNPNIPPQHFDTWRGPPMNAPAGVWYRPQPPAGPPYPPVPHGGFPMEPFPYYRPQIPPPLANSQPGPPQGPNPRGHHPRNGDFYRPQMPDAFIRPGMPIRPGFYPGPVPYDGYFGPPMGYNPNDRDMPFMGMPPGPPGPPVYNMCPPQNPSEINDPHFRSGGRGPVGNMFVSEQLDSLPPDEKSRGPYKVLRKRENERDADMEEDMSSRRNTAVENPPSRMLGNQGYPSDSVIEGARKPKASNESWGKKSEILQTSFPEVSQDVPANNPKDSTLIQKIEGLNAKVRASDVRGVNASGSVREEQKNNNNNNNRLLVNPKDNPTVSFGSISTTDINILRGDNTSKSTTINAPVFSRQVHHGARTRPDHQTKGRPNNQDSDGWRKKSSVLSSEVAGGTFQVPDNHVSAEATTENPENKNISESLTPVDPADGQAQRARMRELAKQRAIQLQKEEEERIREQKAKALAKLEELNRRTLAADGTTQTAEKTAANVSEQEDVDGFQKPAGPVIVDTKHEVLSSGFDAKSQAVVQVSEKSQQESSVSKQNVDKATDAENKTAPLGNDSGLLRQKRASHNRQKQGVQMVESWVDKSTPSGSTGAVLKNPVVVSGEVIPSQESTLPNNMNNVSETTQQRKRNNKSSKNKHKLDDASREGDVAKLESGKPESPQSDVIQSNLLVTDGKDTVQSNMEQMSSLPNEEPHGKATTQYNKTQHSRRMPRNPQANRPADRFHVGDAVVWAPVRAQNKEERGDEHSQKTVQDDVAKNVNSNLKSKRAEMERYVPKPVAKELAQQGNNQQSVSVSPSSPRKNTLEDREESGSQPAIAVPVNVESKSGDNNKQNKQQQQVKPHGAWRQRGPTESHREQGVVPLTSNAKKSYQKPTIQPEALNPVSTETNVTHEWDPSDGWFMPEEYPPTEVTPVTNVVKDETGKGKRPAYKGQRSTVKNHETEVEKNVAQSTEIIDQTDRPASSKENRSSHWQPKPQGYRGGGQNASSEVKRESSNDGRKYAPHVQPEDRRERKPVSLRGNNNNNNMEDEALFEQQQQHASSGFRKFGGGGQNSRSGGQQDNRRQNVNRERQRQNLHYEYQPVGSNNNKSDAPAEVDGSSNAIKYKERGSGQPRRGGGNFYGRQ